MDILGEYLLKGSITEESCCEFPIQLIFQEANEEMNIDITKKVRLLSWQNISRLLLFQDITKITIEW